MNDLEIERLIMLRMATWEYFDKTRIARLNVNFTPPVTGYWLRISILGGINQIASIFINPCIREFGQVNIQFFDRENTGTENIKKYANSLAKHLNCYSAGKLDLLAASTIDVGDTEEGFYQMNVVVPYEYN